MQWKMGNRLVTYIGCLQPPSRMSEKRRPGKNEDLISRKNKHPGKIIFVTFCFRVPVYAHEISGRFDVGGLQSYIECNRHF